MIEYKIPDSDCFKDIFGVVDDAITFAKEINDSVFFVFNQHRVSVYPQSFRGDIVDKYLLGVTIQYNISETNTNDLNEKEKVQNSLD